MTPDRAYVDHLTQTLADRWGIDHGVSAETFAALAAERNMDCRWVVGPIPKLDGHTCRCHLLRDHPLPHRCDCGSWFEGCGRDLRRTRDARGRFVAR